MPNTRYSGSRTQPDKHVRGNVIHINVWDTGSVESKVPDQACFITCQFDRCVGDDFRLGKRPVPDPQFSQTPGKSHPAANGKCSPEKRDVITLVGEFALLRKRIAS